MADGIAEPPLSSSERRYLTIVFVDLVGYAALAERLDPEDLRVLQRRYENLALRVMERFGGFVARFTGEGILVYFGYPIAHENDAERALRAALELVDKLHGLDTRLGETTLPPLAARAGIHTGLVLIAPELVSGGPNEHTVFGEAVNLAARLQAEAPVNGVVVSRETLALVEGQFEHVALGARLIRGLSRTVPIYHVTRAVPAARRPASRLRRGATSMVGREDPLSRMVDRWRLARQERRCQLVTVVGDAGVGKTRLVMELCGHAELADATIVPMNCHELFASTPLYPLGSYLWARVGLTVEDDEAARLRKIGTLLDEYELNDPANREIVASLLGLAVGGIVEQAAPTPLLFKRRQYAFATTLLGRVARAHPTVLWVEDAHWLDPSSAEVLLEAVAALRDAPLRDAPLMIVLTRRSFPLGPALPPADETLAIGQLDAASCRAVARAIPGAEALDDETIGRAIEAAEGMPLFLEQFVISLVEEHQRTPSPGRKPTGMPLMLAEMMSERLDRRPGGRRIVQAAACFGRSFTPDVLAALLHQEPGAVGGPLQALVEAEILLPRRYGAEIRYEFRHALLQRMAYESVVQADRRAMHGRIVEILEDEQLAPAPAIPELRAHHLTEAARYPEAIEAWLLAGRTASRRSADVEAIEHLNRGLRLLDRLPEGDPRRRELELPLQAALMGALIANKGATATEVSDCCQRGLALCREGPPSPLVLPFAFGQFTYTNCSGQVEEAASLARLFLSLAERSGSEPGRVIGHRLLGTVLLGQGRAAEAREQFETSMRLYVPERDAATTDLFGQNTEIHTKSSLSLALVCLGEVKAGLATGIDALRSAESLRHQHSAAIPLTYVGGWVLGLCESVEHQAREARRLVALAEQHQLSAFRAHGLGNLGWALCRDGDLESGAAALEEAIGILDAIGFRLAISGYLCCWADALRQLGRLDEAAAAAGRALRLMTQSSFLWLEPEIRRVDALIAGARFPGEPERAERLLHEALASARRLGFPIFERRCLLSLQSHLGSAGLPPELDGRLAGLAAYAALPAMLDEAFRRPAA